MLRLVIGFVATIVLPATAMAGSVMEDAFEASYQLARQGDAKAQADVAFMYSIGFAVQRDDTQAVRWWSMAAEQGNAVAQYALSGMYREGLGTTRDDTQTVKWLCRAAANGYEPAKAALTTTC